MADANPVDASGDAAPTPVKQDAAPTPVKQDAAPTSVKQDAAPTPVKQDAATTSVKQDAAPTPVKQDAAPTPVKQDGARDDPHAEQPYIAMETETKSPASVESPKANDTQSDEPMNDVSATGETDTDQTGDDTVTAEDTSGQDDEELDLGDPEAEEVDETLNYPLPDDLKFGLAPSEAAFKRHKQDMMKEIMSNFEAYTQKLTELKDKNTFDADVLLVDVEDPCCSGSLQQKKLHVDLLAKHRDLLVEHLDFVEINQELFNVDLLPVEHEGPIDGNEAKIDKLLWMIPEQGPDTLPLFFKAIERLGYRYLEDYMRAADKKPAKIHIDYESKKITFTPRDFEAIVVPPRKPKAKSTSVDTDEKATEDVAMDTGTTEEPSCDKPEEELLPALTLPENPPTTKKLDKSIEIEAVRIRYAFLNPLASTIMLSHWTADDRDMIENVFIHTNHHDVEKTFELLNALRKLIYIDDGFDTGRLDGFTPYCAAFAQVKIFKGDDIGDPPVPEDDQFEPKFVIYDEEGITIFEEHNHMKPEVWFKMHIETTPNSIERIYYHGISGHIMQVDRAGCRAFINLTSAETRTQKAYFDRIKFEMRTNITPKPKDTWNFNDKEVIKKWAEFVRGYIKYSPQDHLYRVPTTEIHSDRDPGLQNGDIQDPDEQLPRLQPVAHGVATSADPSEENWDGSENATAHAISDDRFDIATLIVQLQSTDITRASGDEQIAWVTKWSATEQLIQANTIPESSITSSGIDDNDGKHFKTAIESIKRQMEQDLMPDAVANMRGVEKIFSKSNIQHITNWLSSLPEEKRLQQVFLVKLS